MDYLRISKANRLGVPGTMTCKHSDLKSLAELTQLWRGSSEEEGAAFDAACSERYGAKYQDVLVCECVFKEICDSAKLKLEEPH